MKIDKNIIVLSFGRFVQAILAILSLRLLTELLPQTQVGQQYLINTIILWFSMVLINPVGMYINRHLHEWKASGELIYYIKQMNKYFLGISIVSVPIIFSLKQLALINALDIQLWIYIYFFTYIFFSTWFQTLTSLFNIFNEQKIFISLSIVSQLAGLLCAFAAIKIYDAQAIYWLMGLLVGQIISLIIGSIFVYKYYYLSQKNEPKKNSFFTKQTLHFCYPVALTTLFMWFNSQGYRLLVQHELGLETLAYLGVALGLAASVSSIIESISTQFYFPTFYKSLIDSDAQARSKNWNHLWERSLSIYIPFCFLTITSSQFLIRALTAAKFHHIAGLVVLGAFIEVLRQFSNILYLVAHGEKKTKQTIKPYLIGAIVNLLALAGFKYTGALSEVTVGYALIFSGLVVWILNVYAAKKMIQVRLNYIYSAKVLAVSSPVLLGYFFAEPTDSILKLFIISSLAGIYCLGVVIYLKTVDNRLQSEAL